MSLCWSTYTHKSMQRDTHLICVRVMDMYVYLLCVTGTVAWFWGDVCAPEGNRFTVCGDLHAILCAVKRQASVVHRPCFVLSLVGSTSPEDRTPAGSLKGRPLIEGRPSWKAGQDFEG